MRPPLRSAELLAVYRNSGFSPDPRRVIGLFLLKLFAYLMRLQASGQTVVPNDIAHMVSSADAMVNGFNRTLAVKQLKSAGYASAARALRVPKEQRSNASAQTNMEPVPVAELIARLQTTIETFERADAIASLIARIIVCVLACRSPESRKRLAHSRDATLPPNPSGGACPCPSTIIPVGRGPPYPRPPPFQASCVFWIPGLRPGKLRRVRTITSTAFPERGRASGTQKKLKQLSFAGPQSTAQAQHH